MNEVKDGQQNPQENRLQNVSPYHGIPFLPSQHFNDVLLMQLSCRYPINYRFDRVRGVQWQFRIGGNSKSEEIIIFLPGIYETCSSFLYILDKLVSRGYRAASVDFGEYTKYKQLAKAFDQFIDSIHATKVHLIGDDMGGFIALEIASYQKLETKILSISLINSFSSPVVYKKPSLLFNVFGQLSVRSVLTSEIEDLGIIERGYSSGIFMTKEIEYLIPEVLAARIKLREAKQIPIAPRCDPSAIMTIETMDKAFTFPEEFLPSVALKGCRLALMKFGGDWPHIENPDDTLQYLTAHLRKWGTIPFLPSEIEVEPIVIKKDDEKE